MPGESLHVAIIGGGLCGLALAIALNKRNISYTVYEARCSFTEIGAGLNLGPNAIQAFDAIDPALREKIFALATRNAPGEEDVWFNLRFGAPTDKFRDAHRIAGIKAPPTGNMTLSRNEMLQLLANLIPPEHAKFNKKIADVQQSPDGVTMTFADGTQETASVVIGCDGAHSTVRRLILGSAHPAATPTFSHTGGYRAVLPMRLHESVVGLDIARSSQVFCGPDAYVIMYPINNGENVNIGFWKRVDGEWEGDGWVLHNRKQQMLKDFEDWGETVHRVMECMSEETQFWATFHYEVFPERYCEGRIGVIGDGAHAMCPHQGELEIYVLVWDEPATAWSRLCNSYWFVDLRLTSSAHSSRPRRRPGYGRCFRDG